MSKLTRHDFDLEEIWRAGDFFSRIGGGSRQGRASRVVAIVGV